MSRSASYGFPRQDPGHPAPSYRKSFVLFYPLHYLWPCLYYPRRVSGLFENVAAIQTLDLCTYPIYSYDSLKSFSLGVIPLKSNHLGLAALRQTLCVWMRKEQLAQAPTIKVLCADVGDPVQQVTAVTLVTKHICQLDPWPPIWINNWTPRCPCALDSRQCTPPPTTADTPLSRSECLCRLILFLCSRSRARFPTVLVHKQLFVRFFTRAHGF